MKDHEYLGDGAYAQFDGWGIWLRTERSEGVHEIYLEPEVLQSLNAYASKFYKLNPGVERFTEGR